MEAAADPAAIDTLRWAWDKQSVWSQTANALKHNLFHARRVSLGLTIVAAVLATLAVQLGQLSPLTGRILAASSAVAVGLAALLQNRTPREKVQSWTQARSVAEAMKAETLTYLAGVTPYRGPDRVSVFGDNVERILAHAPDAGGAVIGRTAEQRDLPHVHDVASYITSRVRHQIDTYYEPQMMSMKLKADRFRRIQAALAIFAVLLTGAATLTGWQAFSAWSPVLTTVIAAIAAHAAVNRYDALAGEYHRIVEQLQLLLLGRSSDAALKGRAADDADDRFVAAAEAVISIQNQAWMTRSVAAVVGKHDDAGDTR